MAEYLVPGDLRLIAAKGGHDVLVLRGEEERIRVLGVAVFATHEEAVAEFGRVPFGLDGDPDRPCFLRVVGGPEWPKHVKPVSAGTAQMLLGRDL
ncbi:hypothetical protein [Segniliparus rugosus]|uniref:Uncharacterized protein n=1 Tax=Segniliparus rugosus (strain ATCC BAA-974 / DSM 45345 / CCUG 50838 / CIP 108380 / JCM 13579 / CDC 945) TaxID=679197 RepID=E5XT53_SEGRC|nr:hypothetical protein [Segniliparus rugosus]EFV12464.1 hypothetical protein HMPREF9336_02675 [Segniliparus rugosus ATCC BAA-974]